MPEEKKKTSNYTRGRGKEYKAVNDLKKNLYHATRSASSHGLWDVVGIGHGKIRLVQCKYTKKKGKFTDDENLKKFRNMQVPVAANLAKIDELRESIAQLPIVTDVKEALLEQLEACIDYGAITKELWVYRFGAQGCEMQILNKEGEQNGSSE